MGVMLMVMTPLPYVDTTSSSALDNKWHRIAIGAGGMFVELILAAIFAIIWSVTPNDSALHIISYNMLLLTTVTTVLFNANPLMRFDGYYILSDWLEIPNLRKQSQDYLKYLVKKYLWGMPEEFPYAKGLTTLFIYGLCSVAYRILLLGFITWAIMQLSIILGLIVGLVMLMSTIIKPVWSLLAYLLTHPGLGRHRTRAILSTTLATAIVAASAGIVPLPHQATTIGVIESTQHTTVASQADGVISHITPSTQQVTPGTLLVKLENHQIITEQERVAADLRVLRLQLEHTIAQRTTDDSALLAVDVLQQQEHALQQRVERLQQQRNSMHIVADQLIDWTPAAGAQSVGSWQQGGTPSASCVTAIGSFAAS